MSAEHGETREISGGKEIVSTPGIEPTMEALQPRRIAATSRERQPNSHTPLPMLLPAVPMSIPNHAPNPQTPAPVPEPLPIPAPPSGPEPQTPLPDGVLNAPVIHPVTPP